MLGKPYISVPVVMEAILIYAIQRSKRARHIDQFVYIGEAIQLLSRGRIFDETRKSRDGRLHPPRHQGMNIRLLQIQQAGQPY